MEKLHTKDVDALFEAILSLENSDECYRFFEDVCTIKEILDIAQRLKAAKMLSDGMVYSEISAQTGLSTATISRVNHCIKYGNEGYLKVLKKMKLEEKKRK